MIQNQIEYLIIEDERTSAERLYRQIKRIDAGATVYGPLASVAETIAWFKSNSSVDIILADIRLDDGLCFEVLRHAPSTAAIIFTTAYDEYAIKAFKYNSVDYLLKPINLEELADSITKAKKSIHDHNNLPLDTLLALLNRSTECYRERFLVACSDGYRTVEVKDISHIYTENREVRLCLNDGSTETVNASMEDLEKQLDPKKFIRANRQYIVSIRSVEKLANQLGGKFKLVLRGTPKVNIPISKEKAPIIKAWLDK